MAVGILKGSSSKRHVNHYHGLKKREGWSGLRAYYLAVRLASLQLILPSDFDF